MAVALLLQAIPGELVFQVAQFHTAKEIWEALKTRYVGVERVREAKLEQLENEFESLKMRETETVDSYAGRISQLVTKAASLGTTYENRKLTRKLLGSVPGKYVPIVASIEQFADLKTMTFQEAVGRLKTFEDRIKGIESLAENQGNLMFANGESSSKSKSYENTRGRGRGGSSYRGRRQDRDDEDQDGSQSRDGQDHGSKQTGQRRTNDRQKGRKDRSQVQCYRCDKFGHFASGCPDRMKKKDEANLAKNDDFDPSLFMMRCDQETVFLNEEWVNPKRFETEPMEKDTWYLDNGASNHMTGNQAYFFELNERVTGKVKFGDGSCIDIRGKGSVLLEGKTGEKRLLTNVYYIPSLQSNIISLGQATEGGCDIHMKRDLLTIHDDTGKLMMKVTRTKNRLYKINLKIASPGTQANMIGIKNFAGRDLQRVELKDDTTSTSQNLLKDPSLMKKPKIQSPKKNVQEFKEKVKQGIQTQGGTFNDPRKWVFAQYRSRVNGGASSYDQRTSHGERTSRVPGRKNVRARKEPKNTARNQDEFYENQDKEDMLEPTYFESEIKGVIVGGNSRLITSR
ncbi:putative RNA-directed DNA polymerase [Helianthus annuus]|nr:putative RNA-directed DNA polymerase [Helianthus annuus]KAJ0825313.1 putative RNA-directed DNA polymerase [Helianthus annuus]